MYVGLSINKLRVKRIMRSFKPGVLYYRGFIHEDIFPIVLGDREVQHRWGIDKGNFALYKGYHFRWDWRSEIKR